MPDEVAVILSGCGVYDGTEIHEASAVCVALTRNGKKPVFFAPDTSLYHEINHVTLEADSDTRRSALIESGRIARGKVLNLSDLNAENYDAIIFPGGFGAAKNLCTFAVSPEPEINKDVERVLEEFHSAGKPIGMCCISPIIAAILFSKGEWEKKGPVKLTLGRKSTVDSESGSWPYAGTIDKAVEMGADVVECGVNEVCVDEANKIVTTPAFMYEGEFHEIHDGINKMVNTLLGNNRSPRSDKPKDDEDQNKAINKPCPCSLI